MGSQQSRDDNSLHQGGTVDDRVTVIKIDDIPQRCDSGSKQITQGISRLLEANKNQDYNKNQKGVILLKQVFKKLDPAITYGATFRRQGQLELSFKYDRTKDVLLIKVIRAVTLDAKSLRDSCTNVYIKVFMVHSSSDQEISSTSGTQSLHKTKTIQGTLAPEFHEIFAFPITEDELQNGNVVCQAWNADAMEKDELIGQVTISVSHLLQSKTHTGVYDLMTEVNHDVTGNLKVTMAYQLPNHLSVTVHGANQLDNQSGEHTPNPMVKLQVAGLKEINKTKVHYNTDSPVWEETFKFSVRNEELKRRQLIFHVIDFDDVKKNRSLGQAIVNLGDLELGSDYHGELKLADLKSGRHIHSSQAQNVALQEFKQSLVAHALGKCPNFLFQNKSGTKIIHVHNTKLDSEVSLRVIDAVPVY